MMNRAAACHAAVIVAICHFSCPADGRAQSLPSPWSARDIGSPALAGSASFSNGIFTIEAAGADIGSSRDQFHYVYQPVSGDVDVRARVGSVSLTDEWSRAGVMIRGSLAADAAHGSAFVSAARGTVFQRRTSAGGLTAQTAGPSSSSVRWVRLVRAGSQITAYVSSDGASWTMIAAQTIALGTTAYVGLAATSRDAGTRSTTNLSNVTVTQAALPAGQLNADVGSPAIKGQASYDARRNTYTIRAGGAGIGGAADQFHFVYQAVSGDVDVIARVASISTTDLRSRAGVMIRESLSAGSRHVASLFSAGHRFTFQRRSETGSASEVSDAGVKTLPGWLRLVRTGSIFTSYSSADGSNWTKIGSDTIVMDDAVYIGIAVTSNNITLTTTAVVDNLMIKEATPLENRPPIVSLTAPLDGQLFAGPATVTVAASASDADGQVVSVEFLANATVLGRDSTAPYSMTASGLAPGTYQIRAVATDNLGGSTISPTSTITVTGPTPRWVVFEAPSNHATAVSKYVLRVYKSGAIPSSSSLVATSDLGKPPVGTNGEIIVDRAAFLQALVPGSYISTVTAVGAGGSATSGTAAFIR
jgi:regulation of enolase protein 1 (concanavalin A-like superfamily)